MRLFLFLLFFASAAHAKGERAGDFDYYVLALSWSPTWCALEGDRRGAEQCERSVGWVLHGLWPQFEAGWPSYCRGTQRNPSRSDTAAEADLFGSSGNAWHQWNKHGRCTGLTAAGYYGLARQAFDAITRPELLRQLDEPVRLPASVVEEAFLESNSDLARDRITMTCKAGRIAEARICLTKDLEPRRCGRDVLRDCTDSRALLDPIR